jgi:hypothetical protein
MYYPPIFQIHIALAVCCLVAGSVQTVRQSNAINLAATVVLFLLAIVFARYCLKWKPSKMRSLIERNVVIWNHALGMKNP